MGTTELWTRQAELEYESVLLGQQRYETNRTERGESDTLPGQEQTLRAHAALTTAIMAFIESTSTSAGRSHASAPYLVTVLPEQAAYLTIRHSLDAAAQSLSFTGAAIRVGAAIEDHANLLQLKDDAPGLFRKIMEQVKKSTAEHHRLAVTRHVTRKYGKANLSWSDRDKLILGTKLIELFDETCGLVTKQTNTEGHHHTVARLVFTDQAREWFSKAHAQASLWNPVHQPMIHPPRDWHIETQPRRHTNAEGTVELRDTPVIVGGYLTKAMPRTRLIQTRVSGDDIQANRDNMGNVFASVNAIQRTPWRINKGVLKVMEEVNAAGPGIRHLLVEQPKPLPGRPAGLPEEGVVLTADQQEVLLLWKRKAAEVYAYNSKVESKSGAALQKLVTARKFADETAIYFAHYLD